MTGRDTWRHTIGAGAWAPTGFSNTLSGHSLLSGLQMGYMQQFGSFVVGADLSGSLMRFAKAQRGFFATDGFRTSQRWLVLAQARAGFVVSPDLLLFAQGGLAFGNQKIWTFSTAALNDTASANRTGWTLGLGAAYKMAPNWVAGLEYNYVDFGRHNYALTRNGAPADGIRSNLRNHVFKLTFNYQFGGGTAAVMAKY